MQKIIRGMKMIIYFLLSILVLLSISVSVSGSFTGKSLNKAKAATFLKKCNQIFVKSIPVSVAISTALLTVGGYSNG